MPRPKLPTLPSGWEYVNEDAPPTEPEALTAPQANKQVGSVLREIAGPLKPPDPPPSLLSGFLEPTAKKFAKTLIPTTPMDIGMTLAGMILTGGSAPAAKVMGKVGSSMVPLVEEAGASGLRRILGMTAAGAALGKATGTGAVGGAAQGLLMQVGGEGLRKLTQFAGANTQARQLAAEDPERLGQVVSGIIPKLGSIRTPRDFHAAFKKGAAQQAVSDAYREGIDQISGALGQTPIVSKIITSIRTARPAGQLPVAQNKLLAGLQARAGYSFDDAVETLQRLRTIGWTEEEAARGLAAKDARDVAKELEGEIVSQLPPQLAEKFQAVNGNYARGRRLIGFLDDPKLLKENGDLNIPALQKRIKSEGYSVGQSMQVAADAAELEKSLFRGAGSLAEDVAGEPGSLGARLHLGFLPTFYPHMPKLPSYAGREAAGLNPFQGSMISQMLKRGVNERKPISLVDPDEKP